MGVATQKSDMSCDETSADATTLPEVTATSCNAATGKVLDLESSIRMAFEPGRHSPMVELSVHTRQRLPAVAVAPIMPEVLNVIVALESRVSVMVAE